MKKIKKNRILSILTAIISFLVLLPIVLYFLIQSNTVQNYLTGKVASYFSSKFECTVTVGHVDFGFFNAVILEDFYIEDQQEDTLAFMSSLRFNINNFSLKENIFKFSKLSIDSLKCYLRADTLGNNNYDFITESFSSEEDTTSSSSSIYISLKEIEITNSKFMYNVEKDKYQEHGIDFDNFYLTDFNFFAENFVLDKDSISIFIKDLNLTEQSGFKIEEFSSGLISSANELSTKYLYFKTENSEFITDHMSLNFNSYDDFDNFTQNIEISIKVEEETKLNSSDLAYFISEIWGIDEDLYFSGEINGTINDITAENLSFQYGDDTQLQTSFQITGLPEIKDTYFDFKIDNLTTSQNDISSLKNYETNEQLIPLPGILMRFGIVKYNARIAGYLNSFSVKGDLFTDMGTVYTDVVVSNDTDNKILNIKGLIEGENLEAGILMNNQEQFGELTLKSNIDFSLFEDNSFSGITKTAISQIDFNGYSYQNINIDGTFSEKAFNGSINIDDPNLITEFVGFVDFEKEKPQFDFNLNIPKANLFNLNFEKKDSSSNISAEINAKFVGTTLDDLNGEIKFIKPLVYQKNLQIYTIKTFNIKSYITEYVAGKEKKEFYITSDFFSGKLYGIFEFASLLESLQNFATDYIPSLSAKPKQQKTITDPFAYTMGSNFDFEFNLFDTKQICELFFPELKIADSTKISGEFRDNPTKKYLAFDISTNFIEINDIRTENVLISANTKNNILKTNIFCNNTLISENFKIDTLSLLTSTKNDSLNLILSWKNNSVNLNDGKIRALSVFSRDSSNKQMLINTTFLKDTFHLDNSEWVVNSFNSTIDTTGFLISKLDLVNKNDGVRIGISGKISDNPNDEILIRLLNFNLYSLNSLIPNLKIEGRMVSDIKIKDLTGTPIINSYNAIQGFKLNDVKLGRLIATSEWVQDSSKMKIKVFTERYTNEELVDISADTIKIEYDENTVRNEDSIKYINIAGDYYVETKAIDFSVDFYRLKLSTFKPYLQDFIDGITSSSVLFGKIKLTGTTDNPVIDGELSLKGAAFRIIFSDVFYTIAKDMNITINNKQIKIEETKLNISKGTGYANISGTIYHDFFENMFFDINLSTNNFLFLNTTKSDTSNFYGTVYATGDINLLGRPENLNLTASIKTEKGTEIYYQIDSEQEIDANNSFIKFVDSDESDSEDNEDNEDETDYYGFGLNIRLIIDPETKLQIILDEATGDILNVQGSGDLNLEMNTIGDLSLNGTMTIEKGDYMFTMKNVIKKKFEIEKGGTLKWDGDPTGAFLDLSAIYKIKGVELYDLVLEDEYREVKVPVECYLNINEELMAPSISFDIGLPKANERIISQINNLDDENLNKQVISLLVLGRFQPLPGLTQNEDPSTATGVINTGEVLTNQLNHWLSQISDEFDVGVNYQTGNAITPDEVEVALSTQLWDDRITINGNVGVSGETTASTQSTSNVVGDFDVEVKLTKKGDLKFKVFNKSNDDMMYSGEKDLYTQGIGIFYKKEFDKLFKNKKSIEKDSIK